MQPASVVSLPAVAVLARSARMIRAKPKVENRAAHFASSGVCGKAYATCFVMDVATQLVERCFREYVRSRRCQYCEVLYQRVGLRS